jgi:hypothetical protein
MDSALPCRTLQQLSSAFHRLILHLICAYAPKKRRIFVAPDVVDMILGRDGPAHETFVIFEEFEKKLFGETELSKDRFISIDIGPIVGHLVTKSIAANISRGNRESEGVLGSDFGTVGSVQGAEVPRTQLRDIHGHFFLIPCNI